MTDAAQAAGRAVARLAAAILEVRPLAERLAGPGGIGGVIGMIGDVDGPTRQVVHRVVDRLLAQAPEQPPGRLPGRVPGPAGGAAGAGREPFVRVVRERLDVAALALALASAGPPDPAAVDRIVDDVVRDDVTTLCRTTVVTAPDGARVRATAAGDPHAPAVVIASACGMPVRLAERWIRRFARDHHVVTWESRGLFGGTGPDRPDLRTGVDAQVEDLFAVLAHTGQQRAHVVGLCGGAVLAVEAAARSPERVSGLSLWHGDFDLGPGTPKTDHQRNLQALMAMAARSPEAAAQVHAVLGRALLDSTPPELAHLVLYPYVDPDLLHRYCRLNGAIMERDLRDVLPRVGVPAVVVTSEDDRTAHRDGSLLVAARLPAARLVVNPHGDHLSLFGAGPAFLDDAVRLVRDLGSRV
ncbi:MAG TPA: alpha/beta hydrolase [Kineosporiaceae bacterium]